MVFKGINMRERSKRKRILMFFGCLGITALEIWQKNYFFAVVALILAFFCNSKIDVAPQLHIVERILPMVTSKLSFGPGIRLRQCVPTIKRPNRTS